MLRGLGRRGAPRGLLAADPLYPTGALDAFRALAPPLRIVEVDDVSHCTILSADRGAARVADVVDSSSTALPKEQS